MRQDMDSSLSAIRTSFRGYERKAVDDLLAARDQELASLRARLGDAEAKLEGVRNQEKAMGEAIVAAQKAADELRAKGQTAVEAMIQGAREKISQLEEEAQAKLADLKWDVERLRLERQKFLKQFRAELEHYLREVTEANQGLRVVDGEAQPAEDASNA